MTDTPDYVYQNWLKESYEGSKNVKIIYLLESMNRHLERISELLEAQGRVRPS
jgi:hypothetical protein